MEELYRQRRRALYRFCDALAHNSATAEDLTQETFLRAFRHWGELESLAPEQQMAWLYRTARNLFIDAVRKYSRETELTEEGAWAMGEEDFSLPAVSELLCRLPERERTLFILRYFEGYDSVELGELFDLPSSTVRARLAAARRRLQKWIKEK